ncbi:hypothetical protein BGZ63DRAFT_408455 [Mariannaea sp. PMI_226]|nr:hypothetical protein BGZ63DRAFT_408455 [Mariannaea sp. PMI_226]
MVAFKLLGLVAFLAAVSAQDLPDGGPLPGPPPPGSINPADIIVKGNVFWYNCQGCSCDEAGSSKGFEPSTDCLWMDSSVQSLKLTANNSGEGIDTTCALFSDNYCQNLIQSAGVRNPHSSDCTNVNPGLTVGSIKCYWNA